MKERRSYFRVSVFARISLRRIAPDQLASARRRIRARHVPTSLYPSAAEEAGLLGERRLEVDLLRRIALSLARIDSRIDDALRARSGAHVWDLEDTEPVEIALSASGFAGAYEIALEPEDRVELDLDLWESGLPRIPAIACAVPPDPGSSGVRAFRFEELHPEDEERIVRLTLRSQSEALREERAEEADR